MAASVAHSLCLLLLFFLAAEGGNGFQVELITESNNTKSFVERISSVVDWSNARSAMHGMRLGRGQHQKKHRKHHGGYESPLVPSGDLYLMEIAVGTPPQKFKAIADTGSDLVWLKIDACIACNETTFSTKLSTTYKPLPCSNTACRDVFYDAQGASQSFCFPNSLSPHTARQCGFLYRYGSGVTSGYAGTDAIALTSTTKKKKKKKKSSHRAFPELLIGGSTAYAGFGDASGLVGLGRGPLSLTTQLGSAIQHKFSYCLVNDSSKSSPLLFGEAAKLSGHGIQSTPILPNPTYYELDLHGVNVGGEYIAPEFAQTTVIDTGTVLTFLDAQTYSAVMGILNSSIALPQFPEELAALIGLELCYNTSGHKDYKFPSFSLEFAGGATWKAAPSNYLLLGEETACVALAPQNGIGVNIIGNIMQRNFHIVYDRNESMLSFVPAECSNLT